jgi:hypothetical protein
MAPSSNGVKSPIKKTKRRPSLLKHQSLSLSEETPVGAEVEEVEEVVLDEVVPQHEAEVLFREVV